MCRVVARDTMVCSRTWDWFVLLYQLSKFLLFSLQSSGSQQEAILPPTVHLAMFENIFSCHNDGWGDATGV